MIERLTLIIATFLFVQMQSDSFAQLHGTLPALTSDHAPRTLEETWGDFDPRAEPLDIEMVQHWEEDGVVLQIVRFRVGVFKGEKAMLAAIYGYPKNAKPKSLPGLVQIHGGGQYADHRACLMNAKRGYATISLSWAGRISAPDYRVGPDEVKLFWDGKTDDPNYKITTDWGAVDAYHAPSRNPGNNFPAAKPAEWTVDAVESPRNSPWFLCAIAGRRALTFLEQQSVVDPNRLGVYGHSMGGKLTVMTSVDSRVKAAAPSCGGISDRTNRSEVFQATVCDQHSLSRIKCPIAFLSPSNDFHGRIGDLPRAIDEIESNQWRVTCSPHHNHQDTAEYEVATLLWFDHHLKGTFDFPKTPRTELNLNSPSGVPSISVWPDDSRKIVSVDVFYTQHGKEFELPSDMDNTKTRYWHHAQTTRTEDAWTTALPVGSTDKPLWVYANVSYQLDEPVSGAGYYYGIYKAQTFNVSSLLDKASPQQLVNAGVRPSLKRSDLIESFTGDWEKSWFRYKQDTWTWMTHKLRAAPWQAPAEARLAIDVMSEQANELVIMLDDHAAVTELGGRNQWQTITLTPADFKDFSDDGLKSFNNVRLLKLSDAEHLRPPRGSKSERRVLGKRWKGPDPAFRNLRWVR